MDDENLALILKQCLDEGTKGQWEVFIRLAQPVIAAGVFRCMARSAAYSRELADDLIQDTFLKICADNFRVLKNFRSADSTALRVYLKVIASSIVMDYFRSKRSKPPINLEEVRGQLTSNDKTYEQVQQAKMLDHVEKCLAGADPRSYRVFWLYHREGLRPKEIAALPDIGMGMSGVETAIYRLTSQVRDCLRRAGVLEQAAFREGGRT